MKQIILTLSIVFFLTTNIFAAGSSSSSSGNDTKSNYDQAVKLIKSAKKNEEKGKKDKAQSNYKKAFKLLVKSNKNKPNKADTLNYLAVSYTHLRAHET